MPVIPMPAFLPVAFGAPYVLAALLALPLLWWLLRVTPPLPRRTLFPPLRLLRGLKDEEQTPAATPWWLLLLRLLAAALLIIALADPLLGHSPKLAAPGPLVLVVDNGWTAAKDWDQRQDLIADLLHSAHGRPVAIIPTAGNAPGGLLNEGEAARRVKELQPMPWPGDRAAAAAALGRFNFAAPPALYWLSDGIEDGGSGKLRDALHRFSNVTVYAPGVLAMGMLPVTRDASGFAVTATRAQTGSRQDIEAAAIGARGETLAAARIHFRRGELTAKGHIALPMEVRNATARLAIAGEDSAGAVQLLDKGAAQRSAGIVSEGGKGEVQPLLSDVYYLERALSPYAEIAKGNIGALLDKHVSVLLLADVAKIAGSDLARVRDFVRKGGVLIRFAGDNMAGGADELVPVRLRVGGRYLGSAMAWSAPQHLAPFGAQSPFNGLEIPAEVTVTRQILAEPGMELSDHTWARLTDGTPLITARADGAGWIVLFHVTASPGWSSLPLSGLYVDMLKRLLALSAGTPARELAGLTSLPPVSTLDGFGRVVAPPAEAAPLPAHDFSKARVSPRHPPGLYGAHEVESALNVMRTGEHLSPLTGESIRAYAAAQARPLEPWLLATAMALLLLDYLLSLILRGFTPRLRIWPAGAVLLVSLLVPHFISTARADDATAMKAALDTRLAYVKTGLADVDTISQQGLTGLGLALKARTSYEPLEPIGVDPEHDDLSLYPLLYWPMDPREKSLSPRTLSRISDYMRNGGTIFFDTRDLTLGAVRGPASAGEQTLRRLTAGLDLPPLEQVPADHVLTKTFYILRDFPGRWTGGRLWVEALPPAPKNGAPPARGGDGVSPVIIGGNDWAAAWAIDASGHFPYSVSPGGEAQREMAFRFGINLVMYALTGNYKTDVVHAPALLQRLGTDPLGDAAMTRLAFAPVIPVALLGVFAAVALLLVAYSFYRRARGAWARALAFAVLLFALAGPLLVREKHAPLPDVAVLLTDRSQSMAVGQRSRQAEAARRQLRRMLAAMPGLVVRETSVTTATTGEDNGTQAFAALNAALADVPPSRVAGAILITDGQVHDAPSPQNLSIHAPLQVLVAGKRGERDRKLTVESAARFAIVGQWAAMRLKVEDLGGSGETSAVVDIRIDGKPFGTRLVPVGQDTTIRVPVSHEGENLVELSVGQGPAELTLQNNHAVVTVSGVRDRLRVLLVSGEPHAGERVWRNLLKADPSVDLVHFTILRPPDKQDSTPINELSLIAFPSRELFQEKLGSFDLVIFDRYRERGVLPLIYFQNLASYVQDGGALLISSGPEFAGPESIYRTPLSQVLPAQPTGQIFTGGFKPLVTADGMAHPVTRDLAGRNQDKTPPSWGRWFRIIGVNKIAGQTVMSDAAGRPLLVLDRVGKGRVAELMSDQTWLWARGFEGGGPQAELLRRLAHWLMKEPELEAEKLSATIVGGEVQIERRTMAPQTPPVTLTMPSGRQAILPLTHAEPGIWRASARTDGLGLYRASDGILSTVTAAGPLNPKEVSDMRATAEVLRPVAQASGGSVHWLEDGLPGLRRVGKTSTASGSNWIGLRSNGAYRVTALEQTRLLPQWLALLLIVGSLLLAWRLEGR